jgi:putative ABC transport system permease protein
MISPRWLKVLRDLWDNKSRTILSVLSIAVGVIAFGGMLITRETILVNLNQAYRASNPSDITIDLGPYDRELIRWVKLQPGVQDAAGLTVVNGVMQQPNGAEKDITLYAYADYETMSLNKLKPVSGAYPPGRGELAFERGSVSTTGLSGGINGLNLGDTVQLKLNSDKVYSLRYTGTLYDVNVPGGPAATRANVYVNERTLSDLGMEANPTRLVIQTTPGTSVADKYALADRLRDELALRGVSVRAISVNELNEHWAAATMNGIILILVLVGAVAMVMSGFLIVNVVNGLLLSQKKIIGIMKIVGADRWQIFGVYLTMMASLGLLALVIAMPLSNMLGGALARVLAGVLNFDIVVSGFTPQLAALEVAAAMLVPIAFSASPIWSALRVPAAEAISEVTPRQKTSLIEKVLARLSNLPRTVVLAFRSLFRNNLRLIATMLTLIAAGAIFTSILNIQQGMTATLTRNTGTNNANITVSFGAPISRISAVNRAMQVPGVTYAEGWASSQATVMRETGEGSTLQLVGGESNSRFVDPPLQVGSRWLSPYSAATRDEIVLTQGILDSEPNLKVGGAITLKRGDETRTFRIVGFMNGPGSQGYGHYETISRFAGTPDMATSVRVATAQSDAAFTSVRAEQLRNVFEDANITVVSSQDRATLINTVISAFGVIITLMIVVAVLISVVGGLGLAGTMSLSVMERTREVGVMRAVGAESPDLRFMFVFEGLCIGVMSALIAFVLSWPMSVLLGELLGGALRQGAFSPSLNLTGYGLWVLIVSGVSVIASLSPARRATQISIREALAYA